MNYDVIVTREGEMWVALVPALPGAHTHARTLQALERAVREVIVLMAKLPDDAVDAISIRWDVRTGNSEVDRRTTTVRAERVRAEELSSKVAAETAGVARELAGQGLSFRDIGRLLGISAQRVSQQLNGA